jgi:hypothetical protein
MPLRCLARPTRLPLGLLILVLGLPACAATPTTVGVAGLPRTINVSEWPFWIDIPMEVTDYDRIWRLTLEIVTERHAIAIMDRESGYIRTEWRSDPERTEESRYTFRIRLAESKTRMGVEVRRLPSQRYAAVLNNTPATPWTAVYKELQARLASLR